MDPLPIGTDKTYTLPMTWEGVAYSLEAGEILTFSAKRNKSDTDENSVFQKALGSGITVDGSTSTVAIIREDTEEETASQTLHCDIRATRLDGSSRIVWEGLLKLERAVTRQVTTSRPVNTTNTPLPVVIVQDYDGGDASSTFDLDGDLDGGNA